MGGGVRVRAREWGGVRARVRARGGVRKEGWEIVRPSLVLHFLPTLTLTPVFPIPLYGTQPLPEPILTLTPP